MDAFEHLDMFALSKSKRITCTQFVTQHLHVHDLEFHEEEPCGLRFGRESLKSQQVEEKLGRHLKDLERVGMWLPREFRCIM